MYGFCIVILLLFGFEKKKKKINNYYYYTTTIHNGVTCSHHTSETKEVLIGESLRYYDRAPRYEL